MSTDAKGIKVTEADDATTAAIQAAVQEKVHDFERRLDVPLGDPTAEQLEDYAAGWGDFVIMSESGLVATLPLAKRVEAGRIIPIKNTHATANLTVRPSGDDTIDASGDDVTIAAGSCYGYYCQGEGAWLELWRPPTASSGWVYAPTAVKTANYACSAMYELVRCNITGGSITVTLPSIAGAADLGKLVCVKMVTAAAGNAVNISAASGQTILEPSHSLAIYNYASNVLCVVSATQWLIISDYYMVAS